jgi:nucleotide-binding universal stress UspA family protein
MYQHLLLATDGSKLAQTAVAQSLDLAKALKAKVTIVIATKPWPAAPYGTIPTPSLIDLYEKTGA